tara:strand:- start:1014 stop:1268 length:255 start_codon:yes stop_codon:yes gene_type:complete
MLDNKMLMYSVGIAILINISLPQILMPFATEEEVKPPNGAANLPFKEQLMHMFVHHAQVPLTSSIIVAVIVILSVMGAQNLLKM